MKKINILYTIWNTGYGGAERLVLSIIKGLDKNIYNVIVFSDSQKNGPLETELQKAGAKVILSSVHRFKHPLKFLKQIKRILVEEKIDIIHANDDLNMLFPLLIKKENRKIIAHSHNTKFDITRSKIVSIIAKQIVYKLLKHKSDVRFACGEEAGRALFKSLSFDYIPNGIEIKKFRFDPQKRIQLRKKLGIKNGDLVLLNVGRLYAAKNQSFLVDVFAEYHKLNKHSKLVIIGTGPEKKNIEKHILDLRLSEFVFILPSTNNIHEYYNIADCFIMTSTFEGMPTVSVEAQANGLKCIFSDTISREADHTGESLFIPLEDGTKTWAKAINSIDLARKRDVYDSVKKYDIVEIVKIIDSAYKKIFASKLDNSKK